MEVLDYNKIQPLEGFSGEIKESFQGDIGFARSRESEGLSVAHFHKNTVEYYIVLEGRGTLRVKNKKGIISETELKKGILVRIDSGEIHQTNNLNSLLLEVITHPSWTKEDEIESDLNLFEEK